MSVFDNYESEVRSYCRDFPTVYDKAKGCLLIDELGNKYIDFFSGAGALNYGHNNEYIINYVIDYLNKGGIIHALDMSTVAKRNFIEKFNEVILNPRNLDYKYMFCGPTGTNSVEAAAKLARKVKGRNLIFSFMGAFHGVSLGSLSLTSHNVLRRAAGVPLTDVVFIPYPNNVNFDTIEYIENIINDDHSGVDLPAAIIVETVQGEGGVIVSDVEWLKRLRILCDKYDILLICDEIQVGCGRTGSFFSFERANIIPDMIILSKSISGIGLPMSLLLFKRELDKWMPGEHNGTFRGNQLAFVSAAAALDYYKNHKLLSEVKDKEKIIDEFVKNEILPIDYRIIHRGIGMIYGIDFIKFNNSSNLCKKVVNECFSSGLVAERTGRKSSVLKILPPLVIPIDDLKKGLSIIKNSVSKSLQK